MTEKFIHVWNELSQTPLLWLVVTLVAYCTAEKIWRLSSCIVLLQPVIISSFFIIMLLLYTETPYETYFDGAQFIHFLLGPATVALGIPLYEHRLLVRRAFWPIVGTLVIGAAVATLSAVLVAWCFGVPNEILISIAPKSITSPVAMAVSQQLGGDVSLTAVIVVITGVGGGMCIPLIMRLCGITDKRARGLATGIACHGTGTAFAFQHSPVTGSFSSLGMGASCVITSLLIPPILKLFGI